jgi:hypothetical protein
MPSMLTSVAFSVRQVRRAESPRWIELGFAESDAVGAAGGGGGGGGGGVVFLAQPAISRMANADAMVQFLASVLSVLIVVVIPPGSKTVQ